MAWYDTGTVSVTNGSATVTGSGTNFVSGAQVGEGFYGPDGRLYEIQAIVSATSLTLADNYLGSTQSGQVYKIVPTQSLVANLASQVSTLISDFQTVADEAGEGKFADGSAASPGITFTQDQDTGFFRDTANEIGISIGGAKKAEFNSSGVDVTGTITSDGLTVDGGAGIKTTPYGWGSNFGSLDVGNGGSFSSYDAGGFPSVYITSNAYNNNTNWIANVTDQSCLLTLEGTTGNIKFSASTSDTAAGSPVTFVEHMRIASNGDVSFYEDTGTTPKFFWDASAEALGIGTTSPASKLQLNTSSASDTALTVSNTVASTVATQSSNGSFYLYNYGAYNLIFGTNATERMRIDSSGNVGIGTSSVSSVFGTTVKIFSSGSGGTLDIGGSSVNLRMFGSEGLSLGGVAMSTNHPLAFYTNDAERMRIDSSGRVGIGTTSPQSDLEIQSKTTGTDAVISLTAAGTRRYQIKALTSVGALAFVDESLASERMRITSTGSVGIGTSSPSQKLHLVDSDPKIQLTRTSDFYYGQLSADGFAAFTNANGSAPVIFKTASNERMRIDSSGNLLVGTPSTAISNEGAVIFPSGVMTITNDGGRPLRLNRKTSDGDILQFDQDGAPVGSIGANGGDLYIGTGDTTLKFVDGADLIAPTGTEAATRDGLISFGNSSNRFKDLYLSGGVYLGGTGAANYLDDYEEGTWTPVPVDAATGGNEGSASQSRGIYTKVGNLVTVTVSLVNIDTTGMTAGNDFRVGGLPFTAQSYTTPNMFFSGGVWGAYIAHTGTLTATVADNEDTIRLTEFGDNANTDTVTVSQVTSGTADLYFNITYRTSA